MIHIMISVIVPVYNVEVYLPGCIESILDQTYKDFEILLIDDGSTDNSGKFVMNMPNATTDVLLFISKTKVFIMREILV